VGKDALPKFAFDLEVTLEPKLMDLEDVDPVVDSALDRDLLLPAIAMHT
jgi:hypothetical protein